jgi:hypothetical protein
MHFTQLRSTVTASPEDIARKFKGQKGDNVGDLGGLAARPIGTFLSRAIASSYVRFNYSADCRISN